MQETSDEAWWSAGLRGDADAVGRLFDRHHARVHRHACRLLTSSADAEDVTAAAFFELWRRRRDVRLVNDSVLPWLLVTTTNLARNSARGTRRYRALLERLPRQHHSADAADEVLAGVVDADVAAALRALRPVDAQLLALVVLEGLPVADAAAAAGLTTGAAKTRLHRARARLRASLADHPAARVLTTPGGQPS
ncbi:sigma-70 family RNA polymerase sigma factor [Pseudokineococcus basanitobsidens]|uniref:Sigma-70 family RNA polymerase sigma factor n=1 Tax=Pseudokineococcus basanitobsidens TaxID=1926649 RepID=A0ABU8RPF0_9ACTN